jgi:hypothetical protein
MSWSKRHARNARRKAARARRRAWEGADVWLNGVPTGATLPAWVVRLLGESNSTWDGKDDILVDGVLCSFQGVPY